MNYGKLKSAIAARLARTDLTAVIPDFVTLGEARLWYGFKDVEVDVRPLRLRAMLATETASLAIPAGFLSVAKLSVPGNSVPRVLKYVTPEEFSLLPTTNTPRHYTMQDGVISVQGGTPASFTLSYYKKFSSFAADTDTNWLIENHPNVYFYSALVEAYQHTRKDSMVITAARMYAAAANAAIAADDMERHSGSVLQVPAGFAV